MASSHAPVILRISLRNIVINAWKSQILVPIWHGLDWTGHQEGCTKDAERKRKMELALHSPQDCLRLVTVVT